MKMSMHELDAEIGEIEARIAAERIALDDAVNGWTNSLRDTVASPKTLLALTGVGYAMGKLMFGRKAPAPTTAAPATKTAGVLGLLTGVAGTAIGMMQPKFGAGSVARWAANRYFAKRAARRAAAGAPAVASSMVSRSPVTTPGSGVRY